MAWFNNKDHGKVYDVLAVVKAADKRMINPLICHESHMLVSYQLASGEQKSEQLLFDEVFYHAFHDQKPCYVMVDKSGIRHYHPCQK